MSTSAIGYCVLTKVAEVAEVAEKTAEEADEGGEMTAAPLDPGCAENLAVWLLRKSLKQREGTVTAHSGCAP